MKYKITKYMLISYFIGCITTLVNFLITDLRPMTRLAIGILVGIISGIKIDLMINKIRKELEENDK